MLDREQERVFTIAQRVDSGQQGKPSPKRVSSVQRNDGHLDSGQVIHLEANRTRRNSEQDKTEHVLARQVREVLREEPGLSARAIASKLGCSPTTAAKWKVFIEREQQDGASSSTECVND